MADVFFWVLAVPGLAVSGTALGLWWHLDRELRRRARG